eukprot:3414068-Amphidinium_carterae.1
MTWSLEELKHMWVVLSLRRVLQHSRDAKGENTSLEPRKVTHPLGVVIAEMCHGAQLSTDAETHWLLYIQHALTRMLQSSGKSKSGELPEVAVAALQDASTEAEGTKPKGEVQIDAMQFNRVGVAAKQSGLNSTAHMLWWLVCVVEWDTEQRLFLAFMTEQARRVADLLNEAESTGRSLRTHMFALQANQQGEDAQKSRVQAVQGVLDEIEVVKREAEKLQANIHQSKAVPEKPDGGLNDVCRILELVTKANPDSLEGARRVVQGKQREAAGRARDLHAAQYYALEAKLLQLHYKGKQAMDGEAIQELPPTATGADRGIPDPLPAATLSTVVESAPSLQDHTFLQLLGMPEGAQSATQSIDRCFQRVEVYENFSQKTGKVEDEFENLCRNAVMEARQRCGGRRLVAALKPLLVDLVKRRQRLSSMVNTLRTCGLDQVEKNLLRKHLQPRDLLIALTFSSMPVGPSQARMMSLIAKTDCPLPLLFGWVLPPQVEKSTAIGAFRTTSGAASTAFGTAGVQLCCQIQWGALRELLCTPTNPLVLSLGTRSAMGKSYLLQYLYALQECHFRASATPPLRIHSMPSIDIIGDFAREEALRGVTLADVHGYDSSEELCDGLVATLASSAAAMLLHVSLSADFVREDEAEAGKPRMTADFAALMSVVACGSSCPSIILLIRDVDIYDEAHEEQHWISACVDCIRNTLTGESQSTAHILVWLVPPMKNMAPSELNNEMNTLRKKEAAMVFGPAHAPSLEEALAAAARSGLRFPSIDVLQKRYEAFAAAIRQRTMPGAAIAKPMLKKDIFSELAQRVFAELDSVSAQENLLT